MALQISGLLDIESLDRTEIEAILTRAHFFQPAEGETFRRLDALRGKMIVNLFFEASTRTRVSFEIAAGAALHPLAANKVLEDLGFRAGVNACRFLFHSSHKIALRSELQTFNRIGSHPDPQPEEFTRCKVEIWKKASSTFTEKRHCWTADPVFFYCVGGTNAPYSLLSLVCDIVQRFPSGVCVWPLPSRILISLSASALDR